MYQFSYADVQEDGVAEAREREREAINHSISLLKAAKANGLDVVVNGQLREFLGGFECRCRLIAGRFPVGQAGLIPKNSGQ